MRDASDTRTSNLATETLAEAVGQDRPHDRGNREGYPGFLRLHGIMWVFVLGLGLIFAIAIIVAAN